MPKQIASAFIGFMLLALPGIVRAQKASFDFDSTAKFTLFKTYAWKQGTPAGEYFLDKRIVSAIDAQLTAKGLSRNESTPDLYVLYHAGFSVQRSVNGFINGSGGPYGWRGGLESVDLRLNDLATGTLVIDLVDALKQELVWRGVATKEIDIDVKPEKRDEAIARAVEKILKNYPPKSRA